MIKKKTKKSHHLFWMIKKIFSRPPHFRWKISGLGQNVVKKWFRPPTFLWTNHTLIIRNVVVLDTAVMVSRPLEVILVVLVLISGLAILILVLNVAVLVLNHSVLILVSSH